MSNVTELLIKAGLLNEVQVQVALHDQTIRPEMRLSEILALRGWIAEETVDFFELIWDMRLQQENRQNIGQYFLEARLITAAQVEDVLAEQKINHLLFGEVAVLKGYLKQETVRFFVQHLFPEHHRVKEVSPLSRITKSTQSQMQRRTMSNDDTMQQTEDSVEETKQNYQQQKGKQHLRPFPPKPVAKKRQSPGRNLLGRLTEQVKSKITEVSQPPAPSTTSKQPKSVPQNQRRKIPDESFSTSFDLSEMEHEDLDFDDI